MCFRTLTFGFLFVLWLGLDAQELIPVRITELAELTLTESPTIQRYKLAVNSAKGGLRIQKGMFDYHLFSSAAITRSRLNLFPQDYRDSLTRGNLITRGFIYSAGVSKRFRSGLSANLNVNYQSLSDNFGINRFNESVGPNVSDHAMSSTLSITQPLLRGQGTAVATAMEKSAALNLESARSNLSFSNSLQILEVTTAYWNYLTAHQAAIIYEQNEARVRRLLEITEELVRGDQKPQGDLAQVRADLANQERLSSQAKQQLVVARLNLGRAIGLREEESHAIGTPVDGFPTINESGYTSNGLSLDLFRQMAHENRKDIESNEQLEEALAWQMKLANNDRKPQLDLLGKLNYGGVGMGNNWSDVWAPYTNYRGRDIGIEVGVRFDFRVNNNQAHGAFAQSQAMLSDQETLTDNLARNIDLNVAIALNNIENATAILENAKISMDYYRQVYENEQTKFRNGLTTLLNLILFQERLTFAQLEYLQAQQQFALAIVNLRFETGTLYSIDNTESGEPTFSQEIFYTIPQQ